MTPEIISNEKQHGQYIKTKDGRTGVIRMHSATGDYIVQFGASMQTLKRDEIVQFGGEFYDWSLAIHLGGGCALNVTMEHHNHEDAPRFVSAEIVANHHVPVAED